MPVTQKFFNYEYHLYILYRIPVALRQLQFKIEKISQFFVGIDIYAPHVKSHGAVNVHLFTNEAKLVTSKYCSELARNKQFTYI